jgi:hypothetical protein
MKEKFSPYAVSLNDILWKELVAGEGTENDTECILGSALSCLGRIANHCMSKLQPETLSQILQPAIEKAFKILETTSTNHELRQDVYDFFSQVIHVNKSSTTEFQAKLIASLKNSINSNSGMTKLDKKPELPKLLMDDSDPDDEDNEDNENVHVNFELGPLDEKAQAFTTLAALAEVSPTGFSQFHQQILTLITASIEHFHRCGNAINTSSLAL